ncbi:hybrid sensor histidine kinase/response regulator [Microvirga puerhi]|uniref:histidine kinase n=1 Tax=Microvirga puerhi TaxID=2876078 RepID=A0ABS7VSA4_9HYPH|nr:hypothetical protein [Microvirga puerhi]
MLFGAAILVPLILFSLAAFDDYQQTMRRAEHEALQTVAPLEEHASSVFDAQELILDSIAERVADKDWDEISASQKSLHEYLLQLQAMLPQVSDIVLADERGRPRLTAAPASASLAANISDQDYFVAQRSTLGATYIDGVVKERLSGELAFHSSRRLSEPDLSFRGVIAVAMPPEYFFNLWRSFIPSDDRFVGLVRDDGEFLARQPALGAEPITLPLDSPLMSAARKNRQGVYHGPSPLDGSLGIVAYKKLEKYPLYIVYGVGYPTVLASWYRNLVFYGVATLLAAGLLLVITRYALNVMQAEQQALLQLNAETQQREWIQADLVHAQKLEAIGALTSATAHDFGNFLQVIIVNLHALKGRQADERLESRVAAGLQASEGATKLQRQLLAFAHKQQLDPTVLDVNSVIQGFLPILSHALAPTVTVEMRLQDNLWPALLDKNRLEVALLNLAVNAKHALSSGGRVTVETRNVLLSLADGVDDMTGHFVAITVMDTGTGMPPAIAARAFEPFFTTKEKGRGTGLGLPAVHALAKEFGGTAKIDSALGQGTRVTLYFPSASALTASDE